MGWSTGFTPMTDKQLLELAAKAAGIEVWPGTGLQAHMLFRRSDKPDVSGRVSGVEWNPLADDGDALRLAVRLDMAMGYRAGHYIEAWAVSEHDGGVYRGVVSKDDDPYAAARRAIVRAAAAMAQNSGPEEGDE